MYRTPTGQLDRHALIVALEAGTTLATLGRATGVSRERIRQAVRAHPDTRSRYHVLRPRHPKIR